MPTPPAAHEKAQHTPEFYKRAVKAAIKNEDYQTALKLFQAAPEPGQDHNFCGYAAMKVIQQQLSDECNGAMVDKSNDRLALMAELYKSNAQENDKEFQITQSTIRLQNTDFLKLMLDTGQDIFTDKKQHIYPLHVAVQKDNPDNLKLLLEHLDKRFPDPKEKQQWIQQRKMVDISTVLGKKTVPLTPLDLALEFANRPNTSEKIEQLILEGAANPVIDNNSFFPKPEPMTFRQMHKKLEELKLIQHCDYMISRDNIKRNIRNPFPVDEKKYLKGMGEIEKARQVIERHTPQLALAPTNVNAADMDFTQERLSTPIQGQSSNFLLAQR